MYFEISVPNGKIAKGGKEINQYLTTLNGNYTVEINPVNTLTTINECRAAYFFKVEIVERDTGDDKNIIHTRFKEYAKIPSTSAFTVVDWRNFIKQFQAYIFETLDVLV